MKTANRFWTGIFVLILLYCLNLCAAVSAFDSQRVECPACESSFIDNWEYPEGWELLWDPTSDEEIESGSTAYVSVIGGVSPYKWSVSGTGFWLSSDQTEGLYNTLNADSTACGSATITVTDNFGDKVKGYVRCQNGTWKECYNSGLIAGCSLCQCVGSYELEGHLVGYVTCQPGWGGNGLSHECYCSHDGWGGVRTPTVEDVPYDCGTYQRLTRVRIYYWGCP